MGLRPDWSLLKSKKPSLGEEDEMSAVKPAKLKQVKI